MWQLLRINCVTPGPNIKAMLPAPGPISTVEHPQDITVPSFFSLPRELRDEIYHFVLGEEEECCQSRNCLVRGQDKDFNTFMYREDILPTCDRFSIARTCRIVERSGTGYIEWIDCSPKPPLEQALYRVLIMWLAWQQAGGGWEPTIFSTRIANEETNPFIYRNKEFVSMSCQGHGSDRG